MTTKQERHRKASREWGRRNYAERYEKARAWLAAHPEKQRMYYDRVNAKRHENIEKHRESERKSARKRFFKSLGITQEDYDRMFLQQEGKCWICQAEPITHKSSPLRLLIVDHDHGDGAIRGLLCQKCNKGLGLFNDDLLLIYRAALYLTNNAKEVAA